MERVERLVIIADNMSEVKEVQPEPRDISSEIMAILEEDSDYKIYDIGKFLETVKAEPALSLSLKYKDLSTAQWVKSFVENPEAKSKGQKRTAAIIATADQMNEAGNIFASGVKWIDADKLEETEESS